MLIDALLELVCMGTSTRGSQWVGPVPDLVVTSP